MNQEGYCILLAMRCPGGHLGSCADGRYGIGCAACFPGWTPSQPPTSSLQCTVVALQPRRDIPLVFASSAGVILSRCCSSLAFCNQSSCLGRTCSSTSFRYRIFSSSMPSSCVHRAFPTTAGHKHRELCAGRCTPPLACHARVIVGSTPGSLHLCIRKRGDLQFCDRVSTMRFSG